MTRFTRKTYYPRRLGRDQLSTTRHANIQVTQFYKTHTIIAASQNTENARAGGKFKDLILASAV